MGDRPILFHNDMIAAILDGRKDVTRRTGPMWAKVQPGTRLWVVQIRPIPFGEGRFGVGDDGGVYRIDDGAPRAMRTTPNHNGYHELRLRFNGAQRAFRVNRLVCEAFYRPPEPGEVCRHLNGDRLDNRPDNLDWGTPSQNQRDAAAAGSFAGERGATARLTDADADAIRASREPQAVLAARFDVTQPSISKIRAGKRRGPLPTAPPPNLPRWASRLTLEVVSVTEEVSSTWSAGSAPGAAWVTWMPSVDEAEAHREGFASRAEFLAAWREMHPDYTGSVWRIEFRRVEVPRG